MADSVASPATVEPKPSLSESGAPNAIQNQPDPIPSSTQPQSSTPLTSNPNSNPVLLPPPPSVMYAAGGQPQVPVVLPPSMPSFRPLAPQLPQFSPVGVPNVTYQNPAAPPPGVASAAGNVPQMQPMMSYQVPPGQPANPAIRFAPMPNGYAAAPQGTIPPAVS